MAAADEIRSDFDLGPTNKRLLYEMEALNLLTHVN